MATNGFDLVVCFERDWKGGPDENTYIARQASVTCEWSLTVRRLVANDFSVALKCEQTTFTSANVFFYIKSCTCFEARKFAELTDLSVQPGAVVWSRERYTTEYPVKIIGALISMHGSRRARIPNAMPTAVYDFTGRSPACDVQIRVADKLFYANKGVLAVISPVFCAMFNGEYREKIQRRAGAGGRGAGSENFADLMELADRYDVKSLRNKCERVCRQSIGIPLVDRLKFAVHYRLSEFEDHLIESMNAAAARQLASEENLASLGAQCMQKPFVKCTKFSSNTTAQILP